MNFTENTKLSFQALLNQTCLIKFVYEYEVTIITKYVDSEDPNIKKTVSVVVIRDYGTPPRLLPKTRDKEIKLYVTSLRIWLQHILKFQPLTANAIIAGKKVLEILDDLHTTFVVDNYNSLNVAHFHSDPEIRLLEIELYLQLNQLEATCNH